jgi:hypothetical protein
MNYVTHSMVTDDIRNGRQPPNLVCSAAATLTNLKAPHTHHAWHTAVLVLLPRY